MAPSLKECFALADRVERDREEMIRKLRAERKAALLECNDAIPETVLSEFLSDSPDDSPAMPLESFTIPCGGLGVKPKLPDSGPLGARPVSSNASRHAILKILGERERLCRHTKGSH